jgi:MFS family permease
MNPDLTTPGLDESVEPGRPAALSGTEPQLERETPGGSASAGHDPYAALRIADFRRYSLGMFLRFAGAEMLATAVQWDVTKHFVHAGDKSMSAAAGWVGLAGAVPVIVLAIPAGQLADKFDRKWLTVGAQVAATACAIGLMVTSYCGASLAWLYGLLTLSAVAGVIGGPARSALLPQIVPMSLFSNAATWSSSIMQVAAIGGPAIAGLIIAFEDRGGAFGRAMLPATYLLSALCVAGCATLLSTLKPRPMPAAARKEPATLKTLLAGIKFVRQTPLILATISMDLFAVLLGGAVYLLPVYAQSILHVGSKGFGLMRAMPAVGAVVMALTLAHLPPMKKAGWTLLWAVAGFGVATIVFGISTSFPLSLVMLFLTGALDNISVVVRHTLVQVLTPDAMRGRVSAVNYVFIGASNELGGAESGFTGRLFGPVRSVVYGGIGTLVVVAATAVIWPAVRRFGSLQEAGRE